MSPFILFNEAIFCIKDKLTVSFQATFLRKELHILPEWKGILSVFRTLQSV